VFEMLGHITAVSSDFREEPGSRVPSIRVDDIMVIGGE
jgi:predicted Zn-dependent protease